MAEENIHLLGADDNRYTDDENYIDLLSAVMINMVMKI